MTQRGLHPKFAITNATTAAPTRIERARGFLEAATLSEDWVQSMGRRALALEARHITHIEGSRRTLDQAEWLLTGEPVAEANPDDVRELLKYHRASVSKHLLKEVYEKIRSEAEKDSP